MGETATGWSSRRKLRSHAASFSPWRAADTILHSMRLLTSQPLCCAVCVRASDAQVSGAMHLVEPFGCHHLALATLAYASKPADFACSRVGPSGSAGGPQ